MRNCSLVLLLMVVLAGTLMPALDSNAQGRGRPAFVVTGPDSNTDQDHPHWQQRPGRGIQFIGPDDDRGRNNANRSETSTEVPRFRFEDDDGDGICDHFDDFEHLFDDRHPGNNGRGRRGGPHRGGPGRFGGDAPGSGSTFGLFPELEADQVHVSGSITAVNDPYLSILNGGFVIDASEAQIQYAHWFRGFVQILPFDFEAGQRIALIGELENTDDGPVIYASAIRVMDAWHNLADPNLGSVSGIIEVVDFEAGEVVISGIPVRIDEDTVIRTGWDEGDDIAIGDLATARVILEDSDDDGLVDSLLALAIMIREAE